MHWVIQNGPIREAGYEDLVTALERYDIPYTEVTVVPFSAELIPDVDPDGEVIVMGTVSLAEKVAKRKGWSPGAYTNDNFDYRVWSEKWKGSILNEDAIVCPFRHIPLEWDPFFIRPVKDNKAFSGQIMWMHEYQTWLGRLLVEEGASDLCFDIDEMVIVASPKKIYREYRFWVVDHKVVTGSVYKIGEDVTYQDEGFIDQETWRFVSGHVGKPPFCIGGWAPDRAFVIDVALTEEGHKIIEINCLNSAGFYKADVFKLVQELENV